MKLTCIHRHFCIRATGKTDISARAVDIKLSSTEGFFVVVFYPFALSPTLNVLMVKNNLKTINLTICRIS